MIARSDLTSLIAGRAISSKFSGFGIRGAVAPLTGEHGQALIGPGVSLPAENDDEFRAVILTLPVGLSGLVFDEDGTVEVPEGNPDGSYTGTYRLYKNSSVVAPDPQTYEINIGSSGELSGSSLFLDLSSTGIIYGGSSLQGSAAFEDLVSSGVVESPNGLTGNAVLGDIFSSGAIESRPVLTGSSLLDDITSSGAILSVAPSTLSGTAIFEELVASGALDAPNSLFGTSIFDAIQASGEISAFPPSTITGNATLLELVSSGELSGGNSLTGDALLSGLSSSGAIYSFNPSLVVNNVYTLVIPGPVTVLLDAISGAGVPMNISRKRGDTYADEFVIKSAATQLPVDITGCSFLMTLDSQKSPLDSSTNIYQLVGVVLDGPGGRVNFAPTAEQANRQGSYYYDVQMIDTAGRKRTVALAQYFYKQDISK